jgi:HSP20 family protein
VQVRETKDAIVVSAALPGIDDGSLEVAFEGPLLRISGTRTEHHERTRRRYRRTQRVYRTFEREIPLPRGIDRAGTIATLRKEVLRISIPKEVAPREPARSVPVAPQVSLPS